MYYDSLNDGFSVTNRVVRAINMLTGDKGINEDIIIEYKNNVMDFDEQIQRLKDYFQRDNKSFEEVLNRLNEDSKYEKDNRNIMM